MNGYKKGFTIHSFNKYQMKKYAKGFSKNAYNNLYSNKGKIDIAETNKLYIKIRLTR